MGAYTWQITWCVVFEFIEVVDQVRTQHATPPQVGAETVLGIQVCGELVQQEAVGATHVLLVAKAQAIGERIGLLGKQNFFLMRHRNILLGDSTQVFQWAIFFYHFAERLARHADFFDRHAVASVNNGEPVDFIVDAVVEDTCSSTHGLGGMEVATLFAVNDQF
ncbi:hypothetical protein D9M71_389390 [compost metagenome]